jgi:glutamate-1-semialdehyde 2,1-aminomutase
MEWKLEQHLGEKASYWRPEMGKESKALFEKARKLIPGGVNSPVRAGKAVGIDPPFIDRAEACFLWDVEGNQYVDYVCSWGPMILGHTHPEVVKALQERVQKGTSYGAPTELEVQMAETIINMVPSIEMVRMVNSGTEATMSAIRLARGFTGREKIIKFEGCYHGHADSLLVSAGSGIATFAIPGCPGVPANVAGQTISLPFNDLEGIVQAFEKFPSEIAAVIIEPIPGNMGVIVPKKEFLNGLREITLEQGTLLIFDEVISGFRVGPGGAQELYGVMPDLTCLGKIIGGGLPVGAYGGRKEIMEKMAPEGSIYQAGTLSGNPLAMAAGLATLRVLQNKGVYGELGEKGRMLFSGLEDAAKSAGVKVVINRIGSMGSLFFGEDPVTDFASAKASDSEKYKSYYAKMLEQGIYLAPSAFEACFVSIAHDEKSIQETIDAAARSFDSLS